MSSGISGRINNMKIGTKILIISLALVIIPTVLLGLVAYNSASGAIEEQVEEQFELLVKTTAQETESVYTLTMELVKSGLNVLSYDFYSRGTPAIQNNQLVLLGPAGQVYVVNDNFEIVDGLTRQFEGAAATIFQVQGNQAIRVSTSVIGADGRRVVGTPVAQGVFDAVVTRGQTYYGTANVVGIDYITAYEPIRNAQGSVIGILFVGIPEAASLGVIQQNIRDTVVGQTGYMYVFDSEGKALIHPTLQGQSLTQFDFIRQMIVEKDGLTRYVYEGDDKIVAFAYYQPLDWYIAAGADWEDFTGPIDDIRNAILIIVIGSVIIGGAIALIFGRAIARRMGELVTLGQRVTDGDLSGTVKRDGSGDEIGQVAGAFGDVVTTIQQFGAEMNMISAAAAEGRLNIRGDAGKFKGDYGKIVQGVNETLDSVINPVNEVIRIAGSYADADFNTRFSENISVRGDMQNLKNALNNVSNQVSAVITDVSTYMDQLGKGDIPDTIKKDYPGDFNEIKNNLNKCFDAVNLLVADVNMLAAASVEGRLGTRADASRHQGDFREIVDGVNKTLDAVITPVNEVIRVAGAFAQADFSVRFSDQITVRGDMDKLKSALNNVSIQVSAVLNEVIRVASAFGNADFSTRFQDSVTTHGDMEKLKKALNNVSDQVSRSIGDVNRLMEELAAVAEEANAGVEEVSSGAQQIARNTGRVSENSEKANNGSRQVLRAMEDLSAAVEEVTSNAESVAALARNANDQSKEGAKLAAAAEKGIGEISHSASDVDTIIRGINSQMEQIGKIVGLISDISNQTNLLALNAAIEAARAGDAGRGFAVVAAEVKSLAQESGSSAESIASMIGELQTQAKRAVEAMGTANNAVEAGSEQMEKTINAFNDIVDSVGKISRAIEEVASAAEEQAATVEEITASVHEVTGLIEENAREAGDAAAATEEASAGIDEVAKMIENVTAVANKTLAANQKFKIT